MEMDRAEAEAEARPNRKGAQARMMLGFGPSPRSDYPSQPDLTTAPSLPHLHPISIVAT
jgi:hypothetical protein